MSQEILAIGVNPAGMEAGYQRAVRATETFRRSARGAAGDVDRKDSALARLGRSARTLAPAITALGGTLSMGVAVNRAVNGWLDLDQAMTRSLAIMGDVDAEMRRVMQSTAQEVARDLNFSASQVAESYFFLASAGMDAAQSVAALPAVAAFAKAGMFDLSTATDLATDAQSALGLASQNAQENLGNLTRVTDALVRANTLANASVEQFATALTTRSAAALRMLNKDVEEGLAVLAAYADQGVKGAAAGEQLGIVLRDLQRASRDNRDEFDRLGISVFDAEGNVRNMADIIGEMERVLGPMSAEMRGATLATLGFQDRSQAALVTLLGMSEQIREYEKELRQAGGTTQEVADRQMEAFREQVGRIREGVSQWAGEQAQKLTPALQWSIDNVPVLTDAVMSLALAIGLAGAVGLVPSVLAASGAFVAWTGAIVGLIPAVTSLSGALALLQIAIGPVGWLVAGVTAVTSVIFVWRRRMREAREEAAAMDAQLRTTAEEFAGLGRAATESAMLQFQSQLATSRQEVIALEQALSDARANFRGGLAAGGEINHLEAELAAAVRRQEELEGLAVQAVERWREIRDAVGETNDLLDDFEDPVVRTNEALEITSRLLTEALDLRVASIGEIQELIRREERLRQELQRQGTPLARRVELAKELQAIERSLAENWYPRGLGQLQLQAQALSGMTEPLGRIEGLSTDIARRWAENRNVIIDAGEESAFAWEKAWAASLGAISTGVGGLAGQLASVGQAFLSGGVVGGAGALGGMLLSRLTGGNERSGPMSEVAQEAQRAADALARLTETIDQDFRIRRAALGGDDAELALVRFGVGQEQERRRFPEEFRGALGDDADRIRQMAGNLLDTVGGDIQAALEQLGLPELDTAFGSAIRSYLELLQLQADEYERFVAKQEEAAAREAALRAQQVADFELDMESIRAALDGDDLRLASLQLEAQRDRELDQYRKLLEAGIITTEQFDEMEELLGRRLTRSIEEVNERLAEMEQRALEAAEAERARAEAEAFRQSMDEEALRARLLRAQGFEEEARLIENATAIERAMRDGRSESYLAMLQQLQAQEALNDAMRAASRHAEETARAMNVTSRALNAPSGLRLSLMRWQASLAGTGAQADGVTPAAAARFAGGASTTNVSVGDIHIHVDGDADAELVARTVHEALQREFNRGGGNPLVFARA